MSSLTIDAVDKSYGDVKAVSNVSLDLADGEFLVLVGPSGCGKSTLLRMVAGLEVLNSGKIFMGDRDVSYVDPKDRDVAMVFQNYALYPHMTVFGNMSFSLEQRKIPKDEIRATVMEAARMLDLVPLINRKPGALSGGQKQRVAMGRAIVRNPAIYLMDEPLSNLDAKLRVQMRAELKLMRARLGVTTLYVTHDQVEAMTLGDRVAVLAPYSDRIASNLMQVDSPQTLYRAPVNMFVAGFIGSPAMNFFYVDMVMETEGLSATVTGTDACLSLTESNASSYAALEGYVGRRVVMGVRPEFLGLTPPSQGNDFLAINVDVVVSELVGPDAYLHFNYPTPEVTIAAMEALDDTQDTGQHASRFTARVNSELLAQEDGEMDLFIDIPRLHFFDPETTLRIV